MVERRKRLDSQVASSQDVQILKFNNFKKTQTQKYSMVPNKFSLEKRQLREVVSAAYSF